MQRWVMRPCISPSFSLSLSLCQLLWVSITPQSKWMFGKDYYSQTVKRRLLMSPVFNHHTVEWFYAYFICISLNCVSAGRSELERYKVGGERGRARKRQREKGPYDAYLQKPGTCSMICLLHLLKS